MRFFPNQITLIAGCIWVSAVAPGHGKLSEADLVRLASVIPYVSYQDVLHDRPPSEPIDDVALRETLAKPMEMAEMKRLVDHSDPRVRMLALLKLYRSGDPQAFRSIHTRSGDPGITFPAIPFFGSSASLSLDTEAENREPEVEEEKVGDVVRMMLANVGFHGNVDFEEWSAPRLGNPDWLGWYEFKLRQIMRGSFSVRERMAGCILAVDDLLENRPFAVRAWLAFGHADDLLMIPEENTLFGTREDLIAMAKRLGPDALLAFLTDGTRAGLQNPKLDDPERGKRFLLLNAKEIFRKQDAPALRGLGHFIAAADVDPEMAGVWLREACREWNRDSQGWDRARAMAALLDLRGAQERNFVVKWFYQLETQQTGSTAESVFIKEYRRRAPQDWRESVKELVAHEGFERMNPLETIHLARLVNELGGKTVVEEMACKEENESEIRNLLREHFGLPGISIKRIRPFSGPSIEPAWEVPVEEPTTSLALSPDGRWLAVAERTGRVRVHDATDGKVVGETKVAGEGPMVSFRISDGALLIRNPNGSLMSTLQVDPVKLLQTVKLNGMPLDESVIDAKGRWLASREANDIGISVWDLENKALAWNKKMPIRGLGMISMADDGSRFAVSDGFNRLIHLFEPGNGTPVAVLRGHSDVPQQAAFSPDGKWLVTVGEETRVLLWDARTGQSLDGWVNTTSHAAAVEFSPDSASFYLEGGMDQIARVDVKSGISSKSLTYTGNWVSSMVAVEDGLFALIGKPGSVRGYGSLVRWRFSGKQALPPSR
ncbi:hypothetical protein JIN84_19450 [Luteolibacter yonseiensis]|uniref:WD40 repeat protein n=1 Tax=Luteolibacter yonseiensis TaxID=1144680 RepID=A0A934VD63_9BACT|nr:hypothetical protein [Luteolibacter yonseiensis]MBK1817805.1 hypothetical protein [Luteolibacter yonseiensis]